MVFFLKVIFQLKLQVHSLGRVTPFNDFWYPFGMFYALKEMRQLIHIHLYRLGVQVHIAPLYFFALKKALALVTMALLHNTIIVSLRGTK